MNIKDIVIDFLNEKGYDGFYSESGMCVCLKEEINDHGICDIRCIPGYKTPCDCGRHEYHMKAVK